MASLSLLPAFPAALAAIAPLLLDAHTHLASEADFSDAALAEVVAAAADRSVCGAIAVSESAGQATRCLALAARFPGWMHAGAGVHPVHFSLSGGASARAAEAHAITAFIDAHHEKLCCVGEVGLDFSPWILQQAADITRRMTTAEAAASAPAALVAPTAGIAALPAAASIPAPAAGWKASFDANADAAERAAQIELFRLQIRLALHHNLPLNVHSRNASKHAVALLREEFEQFTSERQGGASVPAGEPPVGVLLHAFDGSLATLRTALRLGCYVSAPSSLQRDPQLSTVLTQLLRESPMIHLQLPIGADSLGPTNATDGAAAPVDSSRRLVTIPSVLLRLVLETDSPALHPIKQPSPSATHAALSESSAAAHSASCCAPELNTPANLYTALLALHALYVEASRARVAVERAAAARKLVAANRPPRQQKGAAAPATAAPALASSAADPDVSQFAAASVMAAAFPAASAGPVANLADTDADPPVLSLVDLAALLLQNTHRLFPRTRLATPPQR